MGLVLKQSVDMMNINVKKIQYIVGFIKRWRLWRADSWPLLFGGACTADVLEADGVEGCSSKQAMSLGPARLTIKSIFKMLKDSRSCDHDWCVVIVVVVKKSGPVRVIVYKWVVIGEFWIEGVLHCWCGKCDCGRLKLWIQGVIHSAEFQES